MPTFKSVSYTAPEYPPLEDLPFDRLPKKEDFVEVDDKEMQEYAISWKSDLALLRALEKEEFKYNTIYDALTEHGETACR